MSLIAELKRRHFLEIAPISNAILSVIPSVRGRYYTVFIPSFNTAQHITQGGGKHSESLS